ncbi:MAG: hypothetical protein KatS3mg087_1148 [Patescibacteria group bacterium]|nr:MAG: hypothetical protein KatS3mg087_1148 [Patescibacteria group bacterium]
MATKIEELKELLDAKKAEASAAVKRAKDLESQLKLLTEQEQVLKDAIELMQTIAQHVQNVVHIRIAQVVTSCLKSVFGDEYELKLEFEKKRNKTEAKLLIKKGNTLLDPMSACGGGILDVASFALRLACVCASNKTKLLVLDEPFKFVSKEYHDKLVALLNEISNRLKIQIIIVSHIPALEIGKLIRI